MQSEMSELYNLLGKQANLSPAERERLKDLLVTISELKNQLERKFASGATSDIHVNANNIDSGTLSTDRYSAYSDLNAESKIGTGAAQVAAGNHGHSHTALTDIGTNTHAQIDTFIASKAQASGLASLNAASLVEQNPASASVNYAPFKIPLSDGSGLIDPRYIGNLPAIYGGTGHTHPNNAKILIGHDPGAPTLPSWKQAAIVDGEGIDTTIDLLSEIQTLTIACEDASESNKGVVELATSAETTAGLAVQANDTRLTNARTPTAHAATHAAAGGDAVDHDTLTNFVANEHIDWTADQGATNIHAGNIPDLSGTYATAAKGVTNGDSHNHDGGDGGQVDHTKLSNIGTNTHTQIDTFIGTKAQASGLASLDGSSKVVQDPANATATPTASKIPIADGSGKLDGWVTAYTDEMAQDAVGSMLADTDTIDFTYTDATPEIKADVKDGSITLAKQANLANSTIIGRVTAGTGVPEALTAANVRTIINVADGATANAKATGAELDTGTDDAKFATAKALADSAYVTETGTVILTNKRITPRSGTAASTATLTLDSDAYDIYTLTAQAEALSIANPSGTPTNGQKIIVRIKDNGTARAITWSGSYWRAIGITLPTTTVISKTVYVGAIWNSTDSKWDVIALAQEA